MGESQRFKFWGPGELWYRCKSHSMLGRGAGVWEEEKTFVFKIEVITCDSVNVRVSWAVGALRPVATCDVSKPLRYNAAGARLQGEKEDAEEVKVSWGQLLV